MIASNATNQYMRNKILTASPAELTLMLYDGCIKFCNIAIRDIQSKNLSGAHTNIMKAERIINEFRSTLNHKYPVAKDFDNVYIYLERRMVEANIAKDPEILSECVEHLRTMRDTWVEVMKSQGGAASKR
ncbi:MAG: flagellar export chaperone FliS [Lachnospiraceae bacterium]|nr:flagellar export chaperone FliS [Lachnospiraceae bacterium]